MLPFGPLTGGGYVGHYLLYFLETSNTAQVSGCDPSIQVSNVPCDDQFSSPGALTTTATVGGVTWHLNRLG